MLKDELQVKKISAPLVLLMAIACGLCTGSNYYNQPLLNSIATEFQISLPTAAYLSFTAQIMYTNVVPLIRPLNSVL